MFPSNTNAVFLLDSDKESIIFIDNPVASVSLCWWNDKFSLFYIAAPPEESGNVGELGAAIEEDILSIPSHLISMKYVVHGSKIKNNSKD